MSNFWLSPRRIYRLHRVCWSSYKSCWRGGRQPVVNSLTEERMSMSAYGYRDKDGHEFTQVTAQCKCGRGGWLRIPKHPYDITTPTNGETN